MESNTKYRLQNETEGTIVHIGGLLDYLKQITDVRKPRGIRYRLEIILVFFILAKFCGQDKVYGIAEWITTTKGIYD